MNNPYSERPWRALYPNDWAEPAPSAEHDMLSLFRRTVAHHGSRDAIRYFDGRLSFAEVDAISDAVAVWLERNGAMPGDRVGVILQNIPQFVLFVIAAWKVGAVPVPANPTYRAAELAKLFSDCRPTVVLADGEIVEETTKALKLAGVDARLVTTSSRSFQTRNDVRVLPPTEIRAGGLTFLDIVALHEGERPSLIDIDTNSIGLLPYTSGTTGMPKGVMLRHGGLAFNALSFERLAGIDHHSRILALAPFFHITGFTCHLGVALASGACVILHHRVIPSVVLDAIREHRPTYTVGAITAFNALINDPGFTPEDLRILDRAGTGGAPVPAALHEKLGMQTGIWLETGYGMTETSAQTVYAPPGRTIPVDPASGAIAIGIPTPGTQILITDEAENSVAIGQPGELRIQGPQVMVGYWEKPDDTAEVLRDGWLRTGDIAVMDEDGWLYLVDRQKDVIIASGFKIWPREVEDVLYAHPAVREVAVVGVADHYRGETVKACLSFKEGQAATIEELTAHCRERLAGYKVPRLFEMRDDLPKTATGKIQRALLR